jgi:hypothetical protein
MRAMSDPVVLCRYDATGLRRVNMLKAALPWVAVFVCISPLGGCKKAEIRGAVQKYDATPIPGAKVFIENSTFATESDSEGRYVLEYAPGAFTIKFEKEGYVSQTLPLNLATIAPYDAPAVKLPPELTRDNAQAIIREHLKLLPVPANAFRTGKQSSMFANDTPEWLMPLVGDNLVTVTPLGESRWAYYTYHAIDIELTPEGQKYKVGDKVVRYVAQAGAYNQDNTCSIMKMADRALVSVTNIRRSVDGNQAAVDFQWQYVNVTPFGKVAPLLSSRLNYDPGRRYDGSVSLTRHDDTWSLPSSWSLPRQRGPWD